MAGKELKEAKMIKIKRALLSVFDKEGLLELAHFLQKQKVEIISTGGTLRALREGAIDVISIAEYSGFPEILGGRLKTLHPRIHGGLLGRRDLPEDRKALEDAQIESIDLLVVNFYPFAACIAKQESIKQNRPDQNSVKQNSTGENSSLDEALDKAFENIDIGGPAMLRAAAKNWRYTVALCQKEDYKSIMEEIASYGAISSELSFQLACSAFNYTAAYDSLVATYLNQQRGESFPKRLTLTYEKVQSLRYGENPHQKAALYRSPLVEEGKRLKLQTEGDLQQLQGKELSYNNFLDADAALKIVLSLPRPGVAVVKHLNPCGFAMIRKESRAEGEQPADPPPDQPDRQLADAWQRARACDPPSAFGGIIAVGGSVGEILAGKLVEHFVEVILAPHFSKRAREILKNKKNLRLLLYTPPPAYLAESPMDNSTESSMKSPMESSTTSSTGSSVENFTENSMEMRKIYNGLLWQQKDEREVDQSSWKVVTKRRPDTATWAALDFAWRVVRWVKSNAILFCSADSSLAIGAGQMSRLDSVELALRKAGKEGLNLQGSVVASDAFFPFRDSLDAIAASGAVAVIQPGGSRRDQEVIDAADEQGLAMVFTARRHFLH